MESRFVARRDQLLADAEVDPGLLQGVWPRLERFLDPFLELLQRSAQGPHARTYVAGLVSDLEYKNVESIAYLHDQARELGRGSWFRQEWPSRQECSLLAVPSNTAVRDWAVAAPPYAGQGRRPRVPFTRLDRWCAALPEPAWQTIEVRAGAKGPVVVQAVWTLVQARTERRVSDVAEVLVVFRERQGDGPWKPDYLLSEEFDGGRFSR